MILTKAIQIIFAGFVLPLPLIVGVSAIFGMKGFVVGVAFYFLILLAVALFQKSILLSLLGSYEKAPVGLLRTLSRAIFSTPHQKAECHIYVYSDPSPNAFVIRGWADHGVILVSRGLIDLLNENELRGILAYCHLKLTQSGCTLETWGAALSAILFKLAPQSWVVLATRAKGAHSGGPMRLSLLSFLQFLFVFPSAQAVLSVSRDSKMDKTKEEFKKSHPEFDRALHKLNLNLQNWSLVKNPAIDALVLSIPSQQARILPV